MSNKIGRNEPCPCGSGKKYKNCCMHSDDLNGRAADPFSRFSQVIASLKVKLDNQYAADFRKAKRDTIDKFLQFSVDTKLPRDNETIYSDWLWFDRTDNDGITPGLKYMEENGTYLEKTWRDCLAALNKSYLSIYEPGPANENHLLVQDIFSRETFSVLLREPWTVNDNTSNILLLGRLAAFAETTIFTGMVLMLKNDADQKNFLINHVDYFQQLIETNELNKFLKNNAAIVYGLFDHAYKKDMLKLNDIRYADIIESEKASLLESLSQNKEIAFLYDADDYSWYTPVGCTGYTRLAIGKDMILTCSDLLSDWEILKKIMDIAVPQLQIQIINNLLTSPDRSKINIWFLIMKDRETEIWMQTPHNELEGRTPSEVLQEDNGKERLLFMLDSFAAQTAGSDEQRELIAYMRERIK